MFEVDWSFLLTTEYVQGLEEGEKRVVTEELLGYLAILHRIKSKTTGSPDPKGPVIPPYRAMAADDTRDTCGIPRRARARAAAAQNK